MLKDIKARTPTRIVIILTSFPYHEYRDVYLAAGAIMRKRGKIAGVADEGGYWPAFSSNEEAIETLAQAIADAGFRKAVASYLAEERAAVGEEIEVLTAYGPFRRSAAED